MKSAKDMTEGSPFALLFGFAFSLMVGNVFQQLYTFVDTMIVGKYLGVTALAALGATEWLVFVMFGCESRRDFLSVWQNGLEAGMKRN